MIAVDTSALIAILADEGEARAFQEILLASDAFIGAPTYLEFAMVAVVKSPVIRLLICRNFSFI